MPKASFPNTDMKKQFSTALHGLYHKALRQTPYRWLVILGMLLYLVSPLDIAPHIFSMIGWLAGGLMMSLLVSKVSQLMAKHIKRKHTMNGAFHRAFASVFGTEVETAFSETFYESADASADEYLGQTITVNAVQVG